MPMKSQAPPPEHSTQYDAVAAVTLLLDLRRLRWMPTEGAIKLGLQSQLVPTMRTRVFVVFATLESNLVLQVC